jgi:hypothetical protein
MPVKDKHTSLLGPFIRYEENKLEWLLSSLHNVSDKLKDNFAEQEHVQMVKKDESGKEKCEKERFRPKINDLAIHHNNIQNKDIQHNSRALLC